MSIDLHTHTTLSDGRLDPESLLALAVKLEVHTIAITDHDTVSGIIPSLTAAGSYPELTVIPGVEINTDAPKAELHILGYFIDYTDSRLISQLEDICQSRLGRALKMINKLCSLGMPVDWNDVEKLAQGSAICRPHVAQAMVDAGHVYSIREAFDKYIGNGCPAYVERKKLLPADAIRLVIDSRGLPVLAHPADIDNLESLLAELTSAGLAGLEVYYKNYTRETVSKLLRLCKKHNLVPTGGTDYHAFGDDNEIILGSVAVPQESVDRLFHMADKHSLDLLRIPV